ncbi:hypothetical protein FHR84_001372 [Actinopolyspora biskrensis]|uniref:DUF8017 domain-containing protein n=1 Tax=Actinopolyspora biskrensis TaxID=1470178 RepID=A0A852YVG3_9ACTN|nr:hypothetical protein [Actinopolyspora biskrensis]NYH78050.1 hypothetical protein [Actinopolyspora biskrensis]
MSLPGGPNNQYGADGGGRQYYDPLSGHPLDGASGHDYQQYRGGHSLPGANVSGNPETSGYQSFAASGTEPGTGFGPAPQAPPKRSYGPTIAVASTAVASIIVIITTLVLVKTGDDRQSSAASTSPSTSAPTTSAPTSTSLTPVEPGWQSVPIGDAGVAYDVPPIWETDHEGITGFENDSGERLTMSNYSTYLDGFCSQASSSYRAVVGLTSIKEPNAESAAETVLRRVARLGWSSSDGTGPRTELDSPQQASLDGGALEGTFLSGTITPADPGPCDSPSTYIGAIALPSQQENVVMIGIADQEAVGSVAPEKVNRSLRSLRLI